jgi:hypothetical protein
MRKVFICSILIAIALEAAPVPHINQPLQPSSAAPGSGSVALTILGTGFTSGSVVLWNGSSLNTTFVNSTTLTATVPASDTATAGTATVTVRNSPNIVSNTAYFQVTTAETAIDFNVSSVFPGTSPLALLLVDVNHDGKLDLIVTNGAGKVSVLLGNGDGTFQTRKAFNVGTRPVAVAAGDFSGDGKIDLAVAEQTTPGTVSVLLGNGDGTFGTATSLNVGNAPDGVVVGDFNGDGKLDIATANYSDGTISILLGNGNGTFQTNVDYPCGAFPLAITVSDFNRDGVLDLAVANGFGSTSISVLLVNSNGTFQTAVSYPAGPANPSKIVAADLNEDGNPDLIVGSANTAGVKASVHVLLGNGNGTFGGPENYTITAFADAPSGLAVADMNGDGQLDVVLSAFSNPDIAVLFGNGDGTLQSAITYAENFQHLVGLATGDLNNDGRTDVIVDNNHTSNAAVMLQFAGPGAQLTPGTLAFGNVPVHTTSSPMTATLTNTGSQALSITSIGISGGYAFDFAQTNDCGTSLPAGSSCKIMATFTPRYEFQETATLEVTDDAGGSPQMVTLTGTGVGPLVTLNPTSVTFATYLVGTTSKMIPVTLQNTGNQTLTINNIAATGDFGETNNCPASLAALAQCTIQVTFSPSAAGTRKGTVTVTDNAFDSPQTITLSGTGTFIKDTPGSIDFGAQKVGTTSSPQTITITNTGATTVSIFNVSIMGASPADFAQTNNCGSALKSGASCRILVTFTPTATGTRQAAVEIFDTDGGSPQKTFVKGTGN